MILTKCSYLKNCSNNKQKSASNCNGEPTGEWKCIFIQIVNEILYKFSQHISFHSQSSSRYFFVCTVCNKILKPKTKTV